MPATFTYLARCVPGLQELVVHLLQDEPFAPVTVRRVEEGLVVFSCKANPGTVARLRTVNGLFLVLAQSEQGGLPGYLRGLANQTGWLAGLDRRVARPGETFRVIVSDEDRTVSADGAVLRRLGDAIAAQSGMTYRPRGPRHEFWALRRRSGALFFGQRLPLPARAATPIERGELRPELASLLCALSEPKPDDVFLDPFAGTGALPLARSAWPVRGLIASDIAPAALETLRRRARAGAFGKAPLRIERIDARTLRELSDASIDAVVTDPPWGLYDSDLPDLAGMYRDAFAAIRRVLKPGGRLVMLLGRSTIGPDFLRDGRVGLRRDFVADILVNGRPATVARWRRERGLPL
ncbi:MAG: methyltransferase domain-containing protein [Thermoflexales bacterium]|nr:methyltransferase domain-containing protein [Thermoflexales bacterium]